MVSGCKHHTHIHRQITGKSPLLWDDKGREDRRAWLPKKMPLFDLFEGLKQLPRASPNTNHPFRALDKKLNWDNYT